MGIINRISSKPHSSHLFAFVCLLAYLWLVYQNAWLSDDAFITMRTVDNFVHTQSPIWNPGERVQVFTHPLWFLCLSLIYFFYADPYLTLYLVSFLASGLAVGVFFFRLAGNKAILLLSFSLIISSKAFVDFSTSGLENPLSHLLMLIFVLVFLSRKIPERRRLFAMALIAGLSALNRLDSFLIFMPALISSGFESSLSRKEIFQVFFAGFIPIILWLGFATFYYGIPLPNTYYAKLHAGIPLSQSVQTESAN